MTNKDMKNHLKELSMNMSKAVSDYAATTNKLATLQTELWNEIGLKQDKIKSLEETIQDKEDEIADLRTFHEIKVDQVNELQKENKELTEICGGVAHYEKKIKQFIKKESVDN